MDKLAFLTADKKSNLKNRQIRQKRDIIRYLSKSNSAKSIPEIAKKIKTSVPTGTKLTKALLDANYLMEEGKKETDNGRRPTLYALNNDKFYVVGVEILSKFMHVSIVRIDLKTVHQNLNRQFILEDSLECRQLINSFIAKTIQESGISNQQIIGVGVGMSEKIHRQTNELAIQSNESEISFKAYLEKELALPVILNHDTRAIGIAEQAMGIAKGVDNVLVVKVSRSLGLSIIVNKKTILGGQGLAGNFAHLRFKDGERLCPCGKTGCLGTEVGGNALQNDLLNALQNGRKSLHFQLEKADTYKYHDVLDAVMMGDALSMQLLQVQGDKLGQALGNVINLLNPDLIVIGGEFVMVQNFFIDAIRMGIKKTALLDALMSCKIEASTLGRYLSSKAGACMFLKSCDMIEY